MAAEDKKLLDALNNLSVALGQIAESLSEKEKEKGGGGGTALNALKSGDFGNQLIKIQKGISGIKDDTKKILKNQQTLSNLSRQASDKTDDVSKKILKNQQTILNLSKQKNNKTDIIEQAGDPKKRKSIRDGVSTIVIIAAGVLAIGLAFKLIGKVDFLSVVALSLSLPLIAMSFEKMSKSGLTAGKMLGLVGVTVLMATAIALSSYVLQYVRPVTAYQALTAIGIAAALAVISFGISKMVKGIKGIKPIDVLFLPLVLIAASTAIAASSYILQHIVPIGISQTLSAIGIAATFVVLSYAIAEITKGLKDIKPKDVILMPLIFVAMSTALWLSSHILKNVADIKVNTLISIVEQSIVLAIMGVVVGASMWVLSKLGLNPGTAIEGGISIVIIAATVMASSLLLNLGNYGNYPDWKWAVGVGLSVVAFGLAMVVLGAIAITGIGLAMIAIGGVSVLIVAGTIVAASAILNTGSYGKYPTLEWATGVGLSLVAFGLSSILLGVPFFPTLVKNGQDAIITIAGTIVMSAAILATGNYGRYPTLEWATGIGLSLVAFGAASMLLGIPLVPTLVKNGQDAIITIAETIVLSAAILSVGNYSKYPSLEWAKGVGESIGAFAPVISKISGGLFGSLFGPSAKDIKDSITMTAQAIVDSSNILSSGNYAKFPSGDYVKNLSSNIKSYMELSTWMAGQGTELYNSFSIMKVANDMNILATSYDKLSLSMKNLSSSINVINADKLKSLRQLLGNMALVSMMDSKAFETMLNTFENKSKGLIDIMSQFNEQQGGGSNIVKTGGSPIVNTSTTGRLSNVKNNNDIYDALTAIYQKLDSISSTNANISEYFDEIRMSNMGIKKY